MTVPLPRLAEPSDLAVQPGVIIADEDVTTAEAVLEGASAYIRLESGDPGRWPTADTIPAAIKTLAVQVAARVWRNPAVASLISVGPFEQRFNSAVDAALYLSETDQRIISLSVARPRIWTQPVYRGDLWYLDSVLVPCVPPGEPFVLDRFGNCGDDLIDPFDIPPEWGGSCG